MQSLTILVGVRALPGTDQLVNNKSRVWIGLGALLGDGLVFRCVRAVPGSVFLDSYTLLASFPAAGKFCQEILPPCLPACLPARLPAYVEGSC